VRLATSLVSNDAVESATARLLAHLPAGSRPMRLDSQGKYALVALDQADAFVRLPVARRTPESIWDHAAGVIVCAQAGCTVTDARGKPLDFGLGPTLAANRGVIAAPPPLHAELLRALHELDLSEP
jgi:3'(2'), 5'-bisphosphate nucleotidase